MIKGFSKLSRKDKISLLKLSPEDEDLLNKSLVSDDSIAEIVDELSENTISHFPFPFGISPNILINKREYMVPLVSEESSVVAAIAKAAGIWYNMGGFKAEVLGTQKKGQVHFFWNDDKSILIRKFDALLDFLNLRLRPLTKNMRKRGGGITKLALIDNTQQLDNYFQLDFSFETADAMGANFINTVLEEAAKSLKQFVMCDQGMDAANLDINMSILSNYVPESLVKASVACSLNQINDFGLNIGVENYASKFIKAVQIAEVNTSRAVTHNKGIFNGIDALALATGNDWRAIEAGAHAYAAHTGQYKSLSKAYVVKDQFVFELTLPLAVGTVGGVTNLHPMAKLAISILNNPDAKELMQIMASVGLASNFSAINALISTGIQKGHMKAHLSNILRQLNATKEQMIGAEKHFSANVVSYSDVEQWLAKNKA